MVCRNLYGVEFWRGVRTGVRLNIMKNMKE